MLKSKNKGVEYRELVEGFSKVLELDANAFLQWVEAYKSVLSGVFEEGATRIWESHLAWELKSSKDYVKGLTLKRESKLKRLEKTDNSNAVLIAKYANRTQVWIADVQENEVLRYRRFAQDYFDTSLFIEEDWNKLVGETVSERAIWGAPSSLSARWKLDFTEGPLRQRKKLRLNFDKVKELGVPLKMAASDSGTTSRGLPTNVKHTETGERIRQVHVDAEYFGDDAEAVNIAETAVEANFVGLNATTAQNSVDPRLGGEAQQNPQQDFPSRPEESPHVAGDNEDGHTGDNSTNLASDDDKNRKVARLLDPNDLVVESYNSARVLGLDICEGLLVICKHNIYLIDNYIRRSDGELDDVSNVSPEQRNIYNVILKGKVFGPADLKHEARKWAYESIKEVHKRKFLFRNVGLEIFLVDGRNFLITLDARDRETVYNRLLSKATAAAATANENLVNEDQTMGLKLQSIFFGASSLVELTSRWERREISNFEYLMRLNTLSGRTYNDLTQYPIFPWVLRDYTSLELDLSDPKVYRDLSKPMGGQDADRAEEFRERYDHWEDPDGKPAFHYGTHYSSAMIVCSYLLRLEPFTQQYLKLQGGHFDHADRLFHSVSYAWESASKLNTTDVRELIPEFYYLPEFLMNMNKHDFGTRQTGEIIDDVLLPPWAKGSPKVFVNRMREALESDYVSEHLHEWIDLIFGFKQTGEEAARSLNVFHYLSYEGAVDIDGIADPIEKQATIGIINNFGQTPRQLFRRPHPKRHPPDPADAFFRIHTHSELLLQSMYPIQDIQQPIAAIQLNSDKITVLGASRALIPPQFTKFVEWGYPDGSVRLCNINDDRVLGIFESMHLGAVTCAQFADEETLITGGTDSVLCVWKLRKIQGLDFVLAQSLRGHRSSVSCLFVCHSFSTIVSGSVEDDFAIVWDLNRMKYVRSLPNEKGIQAVSMNESTGDIVVCSGTTIRVFTINGDLLLSKTTSPQSSDYIMCCAIYTSDDERGGDCVITGHRKSGIRLWRVVPESSRDSSNSIGINPGVRWELRLLRSLEYKVDSAPITCVSPSLSRRYLLSGDAKGRLFAWTLADGSGTEVHWLPNSEVCLGCGPLNVWKRWESWIEHVVFAADARIICCATPEGCEDLGPAGSTRRNY
ncbi:beach-domain-containing protein [Gonapodya prolifera JEL478]|uniref:Beach-domain-containing protein n=1 Tax=Gonapodya prolifera (strain JEL478) TaxID=1344416 RepID=A0A139A3B6_GONPJ|nr:beach-domain-containing protein [Gonapodya prolifera JEL478]|eukprot:KXS11307.1 beach-domain-containing protein [Gonapodya prolifera JEL478]